MSNSRSPRAVRSMTMGTSGMAGTIAGAARSGRRRGGAGCRGAQAPEQALDPPREPAAVEPQRLGDLGGRRAVDEHREQREVVRVDLVRRRVELVARDRRQRRPPRATTRMASKSSDGGAVFATRPSAPATRAISASAGSSTAV